MGSIHIAPDGELDTEPDAYTKVVGEVEGDRLLQVYDGELQDGTDWIFYPDRERWGWAMTFSSEKDARLMFGLWLRTGGFQTPETPSEYIPVEVVREGRDAVAAYLLVATGVRNSRQFVARKLAVTEQTVSNYANRLRWSE
jgi:hypothetical protein